MASNVSDHNVYILGAGFSRDAGAPLIHDFLDKAREFFDNPESDLDDQERLYFSDVFKFKREVAKAREKFRIDLDNIEQLFGLVEMSHRLDTNSSSPRDAMVYLIAKTLQLALISKKERRKVTINLNHAYLGQSSSFKNHVSRIADNNYRFGADIYTHFALLLTGKYDDQKRIQSRASTIITFNYDLVVDDALTRINVKPDYELSNAIYDDLSNISPSISLLKLHGSTNWAVCTKCAQVHILGEKVTNDPDGFRSKLCNNCLKPGLRLLLVPPSWDKSEYTSIMRPIWNKAVNAIKSATRICVIGYSMPETDAFFKFLLALGLAENDHLYKLVVVNRIVPNTDPNALDINQSNNMIVPLDERWKRMLEDVFVDRRYKYYPEGVASFLQGNVFYELNRGEQISSANS